ncbi:hypothetical protein CR513_54822, partial [Mucuna pruriens]
MKCEEVEELTFPTSIHLEVDVLSSTLGNFDSKAYRVFNSKTSIVKKFIHVKFSDSLTTDNKLANLKDDFTNL